MQAYAFWLTPGPQEDLSPLCAKLKDEGVFVRELDTLGIAYHSPALNPFCDKLRRALSAVVPNPKERSKRWLSTCYSLDSDEAGSKTCGPDYHVRLPLLFLLSQDFLFCIAFCSLLGTLSPCNDLPCPMQKSNLSPLHSHCHTPQGIEAASRLCHAQVMASTGRVA